MKRIIAGGLLTAATLLGGLALTEGAVSATTEHCPDHNGHPGKVEGTNNTTVLPAGTVFCVKGSTDATGKLTADGSTNLKTYLGNGHDVSYYVVYEKPPTTTQPPVTTQPPTTLPPETTTPPETTQPPATTTPPETTQPPVETTVAPTVSVTAPPPPPPPPATPTALPETGAETWVLAIIAGLLSMAGLGAVRLARRAD